MDDAHAERTAGAFDLLGPREVLSAVEGAIDFSPDGTVEPYMSYVNRVYGVRGDDGARVVAKFYRPGRWTEEMIREEHEFLAELAEAEIPVIPPLADEDGETLFELDLDTGSETIPINYVLFPRKGGRSFDAEGDEEWYRLGAIVGRMHAVGHRGDAPSRKQLDPQWALQYLEYLLAAEVIHPDVREEFVTLCRETITRIAPRFEDIELQRIHGDCHRGNILDRPGEGLLLIDFDDMMTGPVVQDLWLLLPDRADECGRQLTMLLDGYEEFMPFDRRQLELIEPLRFMRMIHFLAWRAAQRHDDWFLRQEPEWGNRAFWIRELEDFRDQVRAF